MLILIIFYPCILTYKFRFPLENLAQTNVLHLRPGVGQNVAMHASPVAINLLNDKLQSLCPLSLCPNYCL